VPEPARYVLWAIAIGGESGAILDEDREAMRRARREHDLDALRPADPADRLDPHHFAERFGLFLIILLGEVVVSAGQAAVDGHVATFDGWAALGAAMILAAALWWLYFDAASEMNLKVLELSGGSPTIARAIFAVGHTLPAFALLIVAAGVGLLLEEDPPRIAYWLPCVGVGLYLSSTRVFLIAGSRPARLLRFAVLVGTFLLGRLHAVLSPHAYVWLLAGWALLCAFLTTRQSELTDVEALERRFSR
jgi:low temperature requirement protein LtrA